MSTKIFNGYYIDLCTLQELQDFSMLLREKIIGKIERLYAKKLLELSTYNHDEKYVCKPYIPQKYYPLMSAEWKIDERFYNIEKTNRRDPEYDFGFDVTFVPTETKILTLIYTEQAECIKLFESFPNVHPYPYYNNTDKPNTISDEDWDARGHEWDKALEPYDVPALQGFSIKCLIYLPLFNKEELAAYLDLIPSFQQRVNHFAKIQQWDLFFRRYKYHYNTQPQIYECLEWIETKAGNDKLAQLRAKISKQLKHDITIEDLLEDTQASSRTED